VRDDPGRQEAKRTYLNRPDHASSGDIRGAQPKKLHRAFGNKPCRIYNSNDIEGSTTKKSFVTTRRTNPLNPEYVLPSFTKAVVPPVKFMGDRFDVSDIEGAKPREPRILGRGKIRDSMDASDIEGAQADWKPSAARRVAAGPARDTMRTADVTKTPSGDTIRCPENARTQPFGGRFYSNRRFNPVDPNAPVYTIDGRTVGNSPKSRPSPAKAQRSEVFAGTVTGIDGATPNWKPSHLPARTLHRNPNNNADIKGSTPNKRLHRTIFTNREVDPSSPAYIGLEGQPLGTCTRPLTPQEPTVKIDPRIAAAARAEAKRLEIEHVQQKIARLEAAAKPMAAPEAKPKYAAAAARAKAVKAKAKAAPSTPASRVASSADGYGIASTKSVQEFKGKHAESQITATEGGFTKSGADDYGVAAIKSAQEFKGKHAESQITATEGGFMNSGADDYGVAAIKSAQEWAGEDTAGSLGRGLVPKDGACGHLRAPTEFDGMLTSSSLGSGFMTVGAAHYGITAIRNDSEHDGKDTASHLDYHGLVPRNEIGRREETIAVAHARTTKRNAAIAKEMDRLDALMPASDGHDPGATHKDSLGAGLIPISNPTTGVDRVISDDMSRGVAFSRGSGPIIADYVPPTAEEKAAAKAMRFSGADTASSMGEGLLPATRPDDGILRDINMSGHDGMDTKGSLAYGSMMPQQGTCMDEDTERDDQFADMHSASHLSSGMKPTADSSRFSMENVSMGEMEFKPSNGQLGDGMIPKFEGRGLDASGNPGEHADMDPNSSLGRGFIPVAGAHGHDMQDLDGEDDEPGSQLDYMFGETFDGSTTYNREFVDMDAHNVMLETLERKISTKKKKVNASERKQELAALKAKLGELTTPAAADVLVISRGEAKEGESGTAAGSGVKAVRNRSSRRPSESKTSEAATMKAGPSMKRVERREVERIAADMREVATLPDY
jgi:hypothetical protein